MGAFNQLNGAIFDAGAIEARLSAIDGKSIYNQRDGGILDMDSLARRLTALDGKIAVMQGGIEFDVDSFMRRLAAIEAGALLAPPAANMVAWFRKGVGISTSGSAVTAWADQSGLGGRDYAQATGSAQPVLQAGGTILFNGTSHFLATPGFTLNQPYTRYFRIKQVTWGTSHYIGDGAVINTGGIAQRGITPQIDLFAGTGPAASNAALAIGAWGSMAVVFNSASSVLQIDATTTTGDAGLGNPAGLTLGNAAGGGGNCSNIEVAEEIVYNVAHDATQRALVMSYLNTR